MKRYSLIVLVTVLVMLTSATMVSAGQEKVAVCHLDDDGNYILINIADPAVDSHIAHGDEIAGGDVLDENCEPVITARYIDQGDGTVLDTETNLIWLQNANCFGLENWYDANAAAAALNNGECGLTDLSEEGDWRLPTKEEWEDTIAAAVLLECTFPGANTPPSLTDTAGTGCFADGDQPFTGVQSFSYWSSTSYAFNPYDAWRVRLFYGYVNYFYKDSLNYVWPVRGGQ